MQHSPVILLKFGARKRLRICGIHRRDIGTTKGCLECCVTLGPLGLRSVAWSEKMVVAGENGLHFQHLSAMFSVTIHPIWVTSILSIYPKICTMNSTAFQCFPLVCPAGNTPGRLHWQVRRALRPGYGIRRGDAGGYRSSGKHVTRRCGRSGGVGFASRWWFQISH